MDLQQDSVRVVGQTINTVFQFIKKLIVWAYKKIREKIAEAKAQKQQQKEAALEANAKGSDNKNKVITRGVDEASRNTTSINMNSLTEEEKSVLYMFNDLKQKSEKVGILMNIKANPETNQFIVDLKFTEQFHNLANDEKDQVLKETVAGIENIDVSLKKIRGNGGQNLPMSMQLNRASLLAAQRNEERQGERGLISQQLNRSSEATI